MSPEPSSGERVPPAATTAGARLPDVRNQTREALAANFVAWAQPAYRLEQLLAWLYERRVTAWEQCKNLPQPLRAQLAGTYSLGTLELLRKQGSADTTQKFLWRLLRVIFDAQPHSVVAQNFDHCGSFFCH